MRSELNEDNDESDDLKGDSDFLTNVPRIERSRVLEFGHGSVGHGRDSRYWDRDDRRRDGDYNGDVVEQINSLLVVSAFGLVVKDNDYMELAKWMAMLPQNGEVITNLFNQIEYNCGEAQKWRLTMMVDCCRIQQGLEVSKAEIRKNHTQLHWYQVANISASEGCADVLRHLTMKAVTGDRVVELILAPLNSKHSEALKKELKDFLLSLPFGWLSPNNQTIVEAW